MAITIVQSPANVLKAGQVIMYVCSSTKVSETGFRYFVQVYDGSDEVYSGYHAPNPSDYLMFDVGSIAKSLVKPDITSGGTNTIHGAVSVLGDAFKEGININKFLQVRIGEVYEVAGVLTEFPDLQNQDIHIIDGWNKPSEGYGYSLSTVDFGATRKGWATDRVTTTSPSPDHISVSGTYGVIYIGASEEDWGTTGFYNNTNSNPGIGTLTSQIHYEIFDIDGVSLNTHTIPLTAGVGSGLPSSTNEYHKLIHMDTYPANISTSTNYISSDATASPAYETDWNYYVFTPQTAGGTETATKLCVFKKETACKHKYYTLGFQNSFGTYDYFSFTKRVEHTIERKSKKYNKLLGDYDGTLFDFGGHERQEAEYNPTAQKSIKIGNIFTEGEIMVLQNAMVSKEVVLIESMSGLQPNVIPVTIETNSMKVHEELESKLKEVEFTLKVAQTYAFS